MIRDFGIKEYSYTNITLPHTAEDEWVLICQLPYNAHYQPVIKVESDAGKTIKMHSTNLLVQGRQSVQSCETLAGIHSYKAENWISGHGAYYVIPAGVKVLEVQYHETGFDADFTGSFVCNDEKYNVLWEKATRTCYVCMREHFMDCPDRERTPTCLGDVALQIEQIFYGFDPRSHILAKEALITNNKYTHIVDQNLVFAGEDSTWFYYMNTGDRETLVNQYPNMKKYLEENWSIDQDGLNTHKGVPHHGDPDGWDWCDWGSESKDRRIVQCTQYYAALGVLKKIATLAGASSDINSIDERLNSIKDNFDRCFWQGSFYKSTMVDYPDERANAMAIITGLASSDKWESIYSEVLSKKMNTEWEDGSTYNSDSYFERWIMQALCIIGKEDKALERMADRYQEQIESGFSTLYESFGRWWKGSFNPGSSLNHGWNSPNTILSRFITGIQPTQPGWSEFEVLPKEAFLNNIKTLVPTILGDITVVINKDRERYTIEIDVPEKSKAVVGIPKKAFKKISEHCDKLFTETESHFLYEVESGKHNLWVKGEVNILDSIPSGIISKDSSFYDRKSLKVSASSTHTGPYISYSEGKWFEKWNETTPDTAIDGDLYTFWSTGEPQKGGEWFMIDMGSIKSLSQIDLENSWTPYDYPREYRVLVSNDGEAWSDPVVQGKGAQNITRITMPKLETRYIKIEQVSKHQKYWWSISDIHIFA
jgi:alpha-L-rhamnosidase